MFQIELIIPIIQENFSDWLMKLNVSKFQIGGQLSIQERSKIIEDLISFAIKEPTVPLNHTCKPQILMSTNCSDYPYGLGSQRGLNEPKPKIAHLIQYGFETDVLEILLSEIYDYVDKFFITESHVTHFKSIKKPLLWPLLAKQKRFKKYLNKIVYFNVTSQMIDEYAASEHIDTNNIWKNEAAQEHLRFSLFLKWNQDNGNYFNDDDIIGFGDTDEIPSFHNLILMKKCHIKGTTDIGIWFTHNQINKYLITCFHVRGHRNTLGDPTYWLLKDAIKNRHPSRNRGKSPYYLLGGVHLTRYGYLPSMILKGMTATESDGGGSYIINLRKYLELNMSLHEATKKIFFEDPVRKNIQYHDLDEKELNKPPFMMPWIMLCNPLRYPSFLKEFPPDQRLS